MTIILPPGNQQSASSTQGLPEFQVIIDIHGHDKIHKARFAQSPTLVVESIHCDGGAALRHWMQESV